jgi:very-short-patch-repair endonuclease
MPGRSARNEIWRLVARQHGVIARRQLLELGLSPKVVERRLATGRLHALWRGIYAVGRPRVTIRGWWMGGVLACGDRAVLSHMSAALLWGIIGTSTGSEGERDRPVVIHTSVPEDRITRLSGIRAHRRRYLGERDRAVHDGIPVTTPARTLIDLGSQLRHGALEAAVNAADRLELIDPEAVREAVEHHSGMDGVKALRQVLDATTFSLTDSELERRFLRLVRRAGLPKPKTQQRVQGFRVDFYWPDLRLVVETDGLRYHRTAAQQSRDRIRDQAHAAAGLVALRFTHAQVSFDPEHVVRTLRSVATAASVDRPSNAGGNRTKWS